MKSAVFVFSVAALLAQGRERPEFRSRARRLYDRGCLFSPEGRIYQVEYARKAVEQGGAAVGALGKDSVILGAVRSASLRDSLDSIDPESKWRERVFRVDEHVICVACGVVPDAKQLLRAMQRLASDHRRTWGARASPGVLAARLSDFVQSATLRTGNRPFGAAFLIAGYDDDAGAFRLFVTDPAGFYDEFHHIAVLGDVDKAEIDEDDDFVRRVLLASLKHASARRSDESDPVPPRPHDFEAARLSLRDDGTVVSEILDSDGLRDLLSLPSQSPPMPPPEASELQDEPASSTEASVAPTDDADDNVDKSEDETERGDSGSLGGSI